jgi:hypothetical protein
MVSLPSKTNIHVMASYPIDKEKFWLQAIPYEMTWLPTVVAS